MMKLTNAQQLIVRAGFSKTDGRVFDALSKPDLNVSDVARRSGLRRPAVYASLERLLVKKLIVSRIVGKRTVYRRGSAATLRALLGQVHKENDLAMRSIALEDAPADDCVMILKGAA